MTHASLFVLLAIAVFLFALGSFIGGKVDTVLRALALGLAGAIVVIVWVKPPH